MGEVVGSVDVVVEVVGFGGDADGADAVSSGRQDAGDGDSVRGVLGASVVVVVERVAPVVSADRHSGKVGV